MPDPESDAAWPPLDPLRTGVHGLCPRCGQGRLFRGFLALADRCRVCGLDYAFADPADGPAFFVLCFAIVPSLILALWIELHFSPPVWVHLVTSLPVLLATCLLPLRPLKGWLVASQYRYRAREGRIADGGTRP